MIQTNQLVVGVHSQVGSCTKSQVTTTVVGYRDYTLLVYKMHNMM